MEPRLKAKLTTVSTFPLLMDHEFDRNASSVSANSSNPQVVLEYGNELAAHLKTILEDWHASYPMEEPIGSYRYGQPHKRKSQVFSRTGEELSVSKVLIKVSAHLNPALKRKLLRYEMLVLHKQDCPDTFMACVGHGPTFYRAWLGGDSYEDISAVRVFHNDINKIEFSPDIFSKITGTEMPRRIAVGTSAAIPSTSQAAEESREK